MIQHISAVTFAVRAMPEAIAFYTQLGLTLVYGWPEARFSTLQAGEAFVNFLVSPSYTPTWGSRRYRLRSGGRLPCLLPLQNCT
jgi:catechol 2,3-dioxygenase-like lactoylglutathione lyase family enzyme